MIKKFKQYNESLSQNILDKLSSDVRDLKIELLDMIEKSLNSSDIDVIKNFIDSFPTDDSESVIEGLVNDSDIYEFYLKYTDSIDEVLNKADFFKDSPSKYTIVGLYDYLVYGTRKAIKDTISKIKKEII